MKNEKIEELVGRVDALAHFTLALAAKLEMAELIDGEVFTDQLRETAQNRKIADRQLCQQSFRDMLTGLLDQLDSMREHRQSRDLID